MESGSWLLEGEATRGQLSLAPSACRIGLWGPVWRSAGGESAPCKTGRDEQGRGWIEFPMLTPAGEAQALARLERPPDQLTLLLGLREGEEELALAMGEGELGAAELESLRQESERRLLQAREGWKRGQLRLLREGALVGEIHLFEDGAAVGLYSETWMTRGVVGARWEQLGPVAALRFEAEPQLEGEEAVLHLNLVTGSVVAPMSERPLPEELRFETEFGAVEVQEALAAQRAAEEAARDREARFLIRWSQDWTRSNPENCMLTPQDAIWLAGYEGKTASENGACVLEIEPSPPQHGRRLALRVRGGELLSQAWRE